MAVIVVNKAEQLLLHVITEGLHNAPEIRWDDTDGTAYIGYVSCKKSLSVIPDMQSLVIAMRNLADALEKSIDVSSDSDEREPNGDYKYGMTA